jgi:hypothetical protein
MKTSGYDLVLEFNRSFYEKILADVVRSSPEVASGGRTGLSYRLSLREPPVIEGFEGNKVKITGGITLELAILGIRIKLNPLLHLVVALNIDPKKRRIVAESMDSSLSSTSSLAHKAFWSIASVLFGSWLLRHYEKITLPDAYAIALPENPGETQHPIDLEIAKIGSIDGRVIVVCVNLLNRVEATPEWLVDFTEGQDVAFCIFDEAIRRVAKLWWADAGRTEAETTEGRIDVKEDMPLNVFTSLKLALSDVLDNHQLPQRHVVTDSWVDYKIAARFKEPEFQIRAGEELEVPSLKLSLDLDVALRMKVQHPDAGDEAHEDVLTAATFTERNLELDVKGAMAKLYLDRDFKIVARIEKLDVDFDLDWGLPGEIIDRFIDEVEAHVLKVYPAIPVSPSIFNETIPGVGLKLSLDLGDIKTTDDRVIVVGRLQ